MRVTGIIAEYNPLHNGHIYHLTQARHTCGADAVVVVMSGYFVQRGEPAIVDKYRRTRAALLAGADAVLELPVSCATASAERFASGGVEILDRLNVVTDLCYGAEAEDSQLLADTARLLAEEPAEYRDLLQVHLKKNRSFAAARADAAEAMIHGSANLLSRPNMILAVEYRKALLRRSSSIEPHGILRLGSSHEEKSLVSAESGPASAGAIRRALREGASSDSSSPLAAFLPDYSRSTLADYCIFPDDLSFPLQQQLIQWKDLASPVCSPDLLRRILDTRRNLLSFSERTEAVLSAHLTRTHVQRALLHLLLDLPASDHSFGEDISPIPAVRLLGFRRGTPVMRHLQDRSSIPVITRMSDAPESWFSDDLRAADLYRAVVWQKSGIVLPDEYHTGPVIV